jgi:hypothetical protein
MNRAASAKEAVNHDNDVTHEDRGGSPPVKLRTDPYGDRRRSGKYAPLTAGVDLATVRFFASLQ